MKLNEIFESIDGEGLRTGELVTFVRLAGCNLRCNYCDTKYAFNEGIHVDVTYILKRLKELGNRKVTLTGGEPLIHNGIADLISSMHEYDINIETNGSVDIKPYIGLNNVLLTMDYKTKSSGENSKMLLSNIPLLRENDVLKIVMRKEDEAEVFNLLNENMTKAYVYLSPVFGDYEPSELVTFLKHLKNCGVDVSKVRVQVQLHKVIWKPDERGV